MLLKFLKNIQVIQVERKTIISRWLKLDHLYYGDDQSKGNPHLQVLDFYLNVRFNASAGENAILCRMCMC